MRTSAGRCSRLRPGPTGRTVSTCLGIATLVSAVREAERRLARRAGRDAAAQTVAGVLAYSRPEQPIDIWQDIDLRMALLLVDTRATTLSGRRRSRAWVGGWSEVSAAVATVLERDSGRGPGPRPAEILEAARGRLTPGEVRFG